MSDVDARLRSYAERWRAAQPPPRAAPAPRPSKGWAAVATVAASVLAVLTTGTFVVSARRPEPPVAVVPWQYKVEPYQRGPLPRDCRADEIRITYVSLTGPGHEMPSVATVASAAGERCTLRGVELSLRSGGAGEFPVTSMPDVAPPPQPMRPGDELEYHSRWIAPYCGPRPPSLVLAMTAAGWREPLTRRIQWTGELPPCRETFDTRRPSLFRYMAWQLRERDVPKPLVRVEAPSRVEAGGRLRYRLFLENPTDRDMPLDPCPAYGVTLEQPGRRGLAPLTSSGGRLHCEAAPPAVPAGRTVAFDMEFWPGYPRAGEYDLVLNTGLTFEPVVSRVEVAGRVEQDVRACPAEAYRVTGRMHPFARVARGQLQVLNVSDRPCPVAGAAVTLVTPAGRRLVDLPVRRRAPETVQPGGSIWGEFQWPNNCGALVHAYDARLTIPGMPGYAQGPIVRAESPACHGGWLPTLDWDAG